MQDIPYNFDKSHLVRTIDGLRLQCTAKCLAEQFEKETDRPTVFWLEFEGNNNYSNRHPLFSNQYWITIKHQEEQSEYERLILAGLYKGVLDRKRLLWAMPNADYLKKIVTEYTKECRKSAYDMITAINAFVTTIDTELYLNPRGFQTSHAAHEKLLKARIDGLKEYIDLQTANQRRYIWYRETKIFNLLNFANVARVSEKYKYRIEKMINRIYPKSARDEYKCEISNVIDSVKTAYNEYTEDNIESVHEKLLASIIESFELTDILNARRYDVLESEIEIPMATGAKIYSFIPKEIENQGFLARSMKYVRKMISMIQEYTDIADMNRLQYNVGAALIDSKRSCACANGNKQSGYYISFMIGMFDRLKKETENVSLAANEKDALSQYLSEEELKEQIYKYLIYFITAHEYGHILNGDCDGINPEHANKELLATQQAKRLIKCLMPFEDEYHDGMLLGIVPHKQICINNILPKYVSAIVEKLQNEATLL